MSTLREKLKDISDRVDIYLGVGRFDSAEKLLSESISQLGQIANLHNLLGVTYHKQSKFGAAIEQFRKAIEINPKYVEAGLNLTIIYCDLGLYDQGYQNYENLKITLKDRKLPSLVLGRLANYHCQTARYYQDAGLSVEAIKEYEKALTIFPNMPDKLLSLAKLEYSLNLLDKAKTRLRELNTKFAPSLDVYNLLGLIHYREGDFVSSRNYWIKSQELNPDDHLSRTLIRCLQEIAPEKKKPNNFSRL